MQTAVEWLIKQMDIRMDIRIENTTIGEELLEQAKEMEKQQIIDAWIATDNELQRMSAEQYYNETYASKGSDAKCPNCGAMEVDAMSPRTIYECGSNDYDQRPNTFKQSEGCKGSDVEKLAEIEYPIFDGDLLGIAHNQKHSRIDFIKGYNKAKETLYTEEQVIEFTKWLASEWFSMWVKDKFVWEHDWEENQEGQKYQGYYTEKQLLDLFQSLKNKL